MAISTKKPYTNSVKILKGKILSYIENLDKLEPMPDIQTWEYKTIRFDFLGRGITQEFNLLDVDGTRVKGWSMNNTAIKTLPQMMLALGQEGWELVSHVVNQDNQANNVTLHYMTFKRPGELLVETEDPALTGSANIRQIRDKFFVIP
ncbi:MULTISPECIES: hypothetical protein [unclassified Synechocystis]|nr:MULTISPECIES: hypothetical protein [unclassified Synechocystis]